MEKYRFMVSSLGAITEFRKDYDVPNDVRFKLAEPNTLPWDQTGFCSFIVLSIVEGGLCFSVQPLLCLNLGLAELFHQYSLGQTNDDWCYYLKVKKGREKIVKRTPNKDLHGDDFLWVFGNYEDVETLNKLWQSIVRKEDGGKSFTPE
ncbi:hypothetical protein CsSME_00036487 [Camellia sinensis var. sinensis]